MNADVVQAVLLSKFASVRPSGKGWQVRCPAHEDREASLHVERGDTQPAVFHCHAGCGPEAILDALGLTWADLCEPDDNGNGFAAGNGRANGHWSADGDSWAPGGGRIQATYDYVDENEKLLFQVVRLTPRQGRTKDFRQRVPDSAAKSGWRWKLGGTRRVLYRLPQVIAAINDGNMIFIAEGEKDVHALEKVGVVATCNSGGAGKWLPEYTEVFRDAVVRIVADRDAPGRAHARQILSALEGVAAAAEVVEAAEGKDAADHLAAGRSLGDFLVTHESTAPEPVQLAEDVYEFIAGRDEAEDWVIPGVLERGDRLIWTGEEGLGKTTVTRTFSVAAAAGIHPFDDRIFKPQRVLFIDAENPVRQSRREFRKLVEIAKAKRRAVPDGGLRLIHRPEGIDLGQVDERIWLMERVTAHKPDLLIIGPLYKLHETDICEELAARLITAVLDEVRVKADCGLIVEAHAPHGEEGRPRPLRPYGSSLFRRWPEFGYGIRIAAPAKGEKVTKKRVQVAAWRGPRGEREWPSIMEWGRKGIDWPWVRADQEGEEWTPSRMAG